MWFDGLRTDLLIPVFLLFILAPPCVALFNSIVNRSLPSSAVLLLPERMVVVLLKDLNGLGVLFVFSTPSKSCSDLCGWNYCYEVVVFADDFLLFVETIEGLLAIGLATEVTFASGSDALFSFKLCTSLRRESISFSRACFCLRSWRLTLSSILFLSIKAAFSYLLFSIAFCFSSRACCSCSVKLRIVPWALISLSWDSFSGLCWRIRFIWFVKSVLLTFSF